MKRLLAAFLLLILLAGCAGYTDPLADVFPYDLAVYVEPAEGPLTIRGWKIDVTDADVEQQVLMIRSRYSELNAVTGRGAGDMDYLILDYECRIDGKKVDALSETDAATVLGSGAILPEIEQALYGRSEGDTFFVDVTLPTPYKPDVSLSGKRASFFVTVVELDEQTFRPYTDENVQKSTDYQSTAELEAAIRQALWEVRREELSGQLIASAWASVKETAVVHGYPEDVLQTKFADALSLYTISAERAEMTLDDYVQTIGYESEDAFRTSLREKVKENLLSSMLTFAVARQYGITVSEEEYEKGAAAYAESLGLLSVDALELLYEPAEIAENILLDKVQDHLVKTATIVDYETGETLVYADLYPEAKVGLFAPWYVLIAAGAAAVITAAVLLIRTAIRKKQERKSKKKAMLHPAKRR